ncbi:MULTISPECIES: glycosyltransferase family 2 protein [unclassified Leeuwenhoekiella]|uniref:glycosyltransferase family 2 protein n=1 Tax=unclassified Leeuwenhoekiella TaxID=2615029 RepID=UPI000C5F973F|nr:MULTISPECIES: glycosyltransferase family 2 protein [unclassified Leeuwenhoekiella]MAW94133.1 hypothetical protein [Leeuwenhoekiella sp.]MBA82430.1 hypothetical protein [Leeuwenhoekiella sp.]|tara:strand:- start:34829 stop:35764 length:936 start_codon:yes stop_codon:yes gene_type:complete
MKPKFSVVVPVYNKANFVKQTIQSVLDQDFTDYELVLVNDGSTDGSLQILKAFDAPNITLLDQENQGLCAARNAGIQAAKGEIIALLDADDLWEPEHLQNLFELSQNFPEASLYGTAYVELFQDAKPVPPKINLRTSEQQLLIEDFFEASLFQPLVPPSSFAFKKEVVESIGGFDTTVTYFEDVDFYIRANLKFRMAYATRATMHYRFESENQVTHSNLHEQRIADLSKYLEEHPDHKSLRNYIHRHWYFLCNHFKTEGAQKQYKLLRSKLDTRSLNPRQRLLLALPTPALRALRRFKSGLLKKGFRVTSF